LRLLYAGTWLDQRGIFYIRDAMLRLAPRMPGLKLTIAGPGAPAEKVMGFFGPELAGHVEVRPAIAAGSMQELYAEHDIFVFPSLMEGLPSVLLEAMAGGMPVITANTCGMPDMVQDGVNGLLVPPADAVALENAIARLAESEPLRRELGSAAQEAMKQYEWSSAAQKLEELFLKVVRAEETETA
jgi:glycosyltransferase involved in cell wall biosynthesis